MKKGQVSRRSLNCFLTHCQQSEQAQICNNKWNGLKNPGDNVANRNALTVSFEDRIDGDGESNECPGTDDHLFFIAEIAWI